MNDTEIDVLANESRNLTNKTGEHNLWKAVLKLPAWYFVAQGSGEDVEPLVAKVGGRPTLLAFTSEERATAFTRHLESRQGGARRGVLDMEVADAVAYCQRLFEAGVETIHFNSGDYEFSSGMIKLKDMAGRYGS
ncbi:MAG TPA: hypothetical protein VD997_08525 [Phycisphaerales bacterium]|nr:hypothetical protein [Phycisphaerales bacterium]